MNFLMMLLLMTEVPQGMTGSWHGEARPVNDFLARKPIPVALTIGADGRAGGTVGEAKMVEAKIRPRAWYEWKVMNHFEYRVDFRLEGELVPGVKRSGARILLNLREDHWEGWIITAGGLFGGKDSIQIQARDLVMRRGN